MKKLHTLYFNGLGSGKTGLSERIASSYLSHHGFEVVHVPVNWYAEETFQDLFDRIVKLVREQLQEHGRLLLTGSSAGGSLAVNILGRLHDENLSVVTLCSRLQNADLAWWDGRSLTRMAHINSPRPSHIFFDSVMHCNEVTTPSLTKADKQKITTVQQWADFVVPRQTMGISGVNACKVPGFGHGVGIAMGVWSLPKILHKS